MSSDSRTQLLEMLESQRFVIGLVREHWLRERPHLTIAEVLTAAGHPAGTHHGEQSRTTCPLCQNTNPQAFSYTEEIWHCFRCNEGGNTYQLQRLLGLLEAPPTPTLVQLGGVRAYVVSAQGKQQGGAFLKPSERLAAMVREQEKARQEEAASWHREASDLLADADVTFRYTGHLLGGLEMAVELAVEADQLFLAADRVLRCPCSRVAAGI
jgi:hypothetical protein